MSAADTIVELRRRPLPWAPDDGGRVTAGYRGRTGDCVVRSIAIAAQLDYADVYDDLFGRQRAAGVRDPSPRNGVHPKVYRPLLDALGFTWTPTMQVGAGCRVHLARGELPPDGRLVVRLSKHLCAVVDGVVHDTHDPSRGGTRCVYGYWTAPR